MVRGEAWGAGASWGGLQSPSQEPGTDSDHSGTPTEQRPPEVSRSCPGTDGEPEVVLGGGAAHGQVHGSAHPGLGPGPRHWEGKGTAGMALSWVWDMVRGGAETAHAAGPGVSLQLWRLAHNQAKRAALL